MKINKTTFTNIMLDNLNDSTSENGKVGLDHFIKLTNEAYESINCTSSCTDLKYKETISFEEWLEKQLSILRVNKRYFLFSGQEEGNPKKYLVDDCDDRETAIAKMETEYPNFKWVMTETFNAC